MKRKLTALLTFALVGSLMFMGFAGTAAAQESLVDIGSDVDTTQNAESAVIVDNDQQNTNSQIQIAESSASSQKSTAQTTAVQQQDVTQVNENSVTEVTSTATNTANTDASTGVDLNVTADIGLGADAANGGLLGA